MSRPLQFVEFMGLNATNVDEVLITPDDADIAHFLEARVKWWEVCKTAYFLLALDEKKSLRDGFLSL